jgi:hypothetical protein
LNQKSRGELKMTETPAVYETQPSISAQTAEAVFVGGDLAKLSSAQRLEYYQHLCKSLDLNPLTRPFEYITLNARLTLYAKRDAAEQLRRRDHVALTITAREMIQDVYVVTARAVLPDGRADESTGAVAVGSLKGDALANAMMKAETKAKRRVTLSICGLGFLDETEIETIPDAQPVSTADVDAERHWADDPQRRAAFWAWARSQSLSNIDIHKLLNIDSLRDWPGTIDELKQHIATKIAERTAENAPPNLI